jgi:hypothetical protein
MCILSLKSFHYTLEHFIPPSPACEGYRDLLRMERKTLSCSSTCVIGSFHEHLITANPCGYINLGHLQAKLGAWSRAWVGVGALDSSPSSIM